MLFSPGFEKTMHLEFREIDSIAFLAQERKNLPLKLLEV